MSKDSQRFRHASFWRQTNIKNLMRLYASSCQSTCHCACRDSTPLTHFCNTYPLLASWAHASRSRWQREPKYYEIIMFGCLPIVTKQWCIVLIKNDSLQWHLYVRIDKVEEFLKEWIRLISCWTPEHVLPRQVLLHLELFHFWRWVIWQVHYNREYLDCVENWKVSSPVDNSCEYKNGKRNNIELRGFLFASYLRHCKKLIQQFGKFNWTFFHILHSSHRRLQGRGPGGPCPPQRPDKNDKNDPICSILHYPKIISQGSYPQTPPKFANLLRIFGARCRWPPPMRTSGAACDSSKPPAFV